MTIEQKLIDAYKAAKYIVHDNGNKYQITVGKINESFNNFLANHGINTAFFITPENPFSEELSKQENTLRHARFMSTLKKLNCNYIEGYGTDENDSWPREKSYLIFSDEHDRMCTLAEHYGQNAILRITANKCVQLLVLESANYKILSNS